MKKKILVVDDERDFVDFLKKNLRCSNFDPISVINPTDAIREAIDKRPDLILLDLFMPHKDGYQVLRELKTNEITQHIPVIIVSGWISPNLKAVAKEFGVKDYLQKPCNIKTVLSSINKNLI